MLGGNYHGVLCDLEKMSAVKHRPGKHLDIQPALALLYINSNICDEVMMIGLYHFQNWKKEPFGFPCVYDGQGASVSIV